LKKNNLTHLFQQNEEFETTKQSETENIGDITNLELITDFDYIDIESSLNLVEIEDVGILDEEEEIEAYLDETSLQIPIGNYVEFVERSLVMQEPSIKRTKTIGFVLQQLQSKPSIELYYLLHKYKTHKPITCDPSSYRINLEKVIQNYNKKTIEERLFCLISLFLAFTNCNISRYKSKLFKFETKNDVILPYQLEEYSFESDLEQKLKRMNLSYKKTKKTHSKFI